MSIEGQGHFLTLFFQVLYILCLYEAQISGERLRDHWSSGFIDTDVHLFLHLDIFAPMGGGGGRKGLFLVL